MTFEEIVARFPGPRKPNGRGGFKVNCSLGHDQATPSLSITPSNGAGPKFKCFGCGADRKEIIEAAGMTLADILPPRSPGKITRHEAHDASGNLAAVHVREDFTDGRAKKTWWERPDGMLGLGGRKLETLRLYGIDRLPAEVPVVVCEGEKATDAARANGVPAVGTVTGATGTPNDGALRPLLRGTVYLWPDNDDVGREHMARIGAALLRLGHPDVRIIDWKDAPEKGDAADFFALEAARDKFDALTAEAGAISAAEEWQHPGIFSTEDFYAFMPMHNYVFLPTREYWPASSVNAQVPKKKSMDAAAWLDRHRHVEQITWYPGAPVVIEDRKIDAGGWCEHPGVKVLNRYRPAPERGGDPAEAGPWREHLARIYPEECAHVERWLAHRVQRPGEKINHGMIFGGAQGIGKDTVIVPVKRAVGDWNLSEVSPTNLVESFDGWKESVILCVSEARDLGGNDLTATNRYSLYEHMKTLTASPPDVLRVNVKHVRQYYVPNIVGVVITTNHRDGVYLPPDDRRFFVAWSETTKEDLTPGYFKTLYEWYGDGGADHVAAYLAALDLSDFNPKAPPPWTAAKAMMVDAGRDENLSPIGDALTTIKANGQSIDAVTINDLVAHIESSELREMLTGLKNARRVPHLMEAWGYVKVVNEGAKDGRWVVKNRRQPIYVKRELSHQARLNAARELERAKEPF